MNTKAIFALCMVVAVVSFLGFVVENVWLAATKGYMDNRNMFFPFLIGYGVAILLIYVIVGTPRKMWIFGKVIAAKNPIVRRILYLLAAMLCVCIGEIILGTMVEKLCHFSWWDYSRLPLHITKYTSIPTSTMFGLLISIFMECFFVPLYLFFKKWNDIILGVVAVSISLVMVCDYGYHAYRMYKEHRTIRRWKVDTTGWRVYRKLHEEDVLAE